MSTYQAQSGEVDKNNAASALEKSSAADEILFNFFYPLAIQVFLSFFNISYFVLICIAY